MRQRPFIVAPDKPPANLFPKLRITIQIDPNTGEQKLEVPQGWKETDTALVLNQVITSLLGAHQQKESMVINTERVTAPKPDNYLGSQEDWEAGKV